MAGDRGRSSSAPSAWHLRKTDPQLKSELHAALHPQHGPVGSFVRPSFPCVLSGHFLGCFSESFSVKLDKRTGFLRIRRAALLEPKAAKPNRGRLVRSITTAVHRHRGNRLEKNPIPVEQLRPGFRSLPGHLNRDAMVRHTESSASCESQFDTRFVHHRCTSTWSDTDVLYSGSTTSNGGGRLAGRGVEIFVDDQARTASAC